MKRSVHTRHKWSFIDLCYDGMYDKERLKGDLKKVYQRATRNRLKRENNKEVSSWLNQSGKALETN